MICHLASFAAWVVPFGGILGPWVCMELKRRERPAIVPHAVAAMNFQATILVADLAILMGWFATLLGGGIRSASMALPQMLAFLVLLLAVQAAKFGFPLREGLRAQAGVPSRYPFSLHIFSLRA